MSTFFLNFHMILLPKDVISFSRFFVYKIELSHQSTRHCDRNSKLNNATTIEMAIEPLGTNIVSLGTNFVVLCTNTGTSIVSAGKNILSLDTNNPCNNKTWYNDVQCNSSPTPYQHSFSIFVVSVHISFVFCCRL